MQNVSRMRKGQHNMEDHKIPMGCSYPKEIFFNKKGIQMCYWNQLCSLSLHKASERQCANAGVPFRQVWCFVVAGLQFIPMPADTSREKLALAQPPGQSHPHFLQWDTFTPSFYVGLQSSRKSGHFIQTLSSQRNKSRLCQSVNHSASLLSAQCFSPPLSSFCSNGHRDQISISLNEDQDVNLCIFVSCRHSNFNM